MAQISRYPAKVMNITQSYKGSFSQMPGEVIFMRRLTVL